MNVLYGIASLKNSLAKAKPTKVLVITSRLVTTKHKELISKINMSAPSGTFMTLADGESLKTWSSLENLLKKFTALKLDKKSVVVVVGGGSMGDAIGFACSIYLRGIRYINIPTTLLAQVDSAHGGKTAINFGDFKNQIGTIHESFATIIETSFLNTLPKEEIISGLGEIIKSGFIADPSILPLLKKETLTTLLKSKNLKSIIEKSIKVKEKCVSEDLHDEGVRQFLNVGHTIGHALELNHQLSHGRAVLVGMVDEFKMSEKFGVSKDGIAKELDEVLLKLGVVIKKYKLDFKGVERDKRIRGNTLKWPIIIEIGKTEIIEISLEKFKKLYESVIVKA